jgi:hypothetical protein
MATEKIIVGVDDATIELKGAEKDAFIADRIAITESRELLEAEYNAKKQARIDAITKLGEASGLTPAEIEAILNI